MKCRYCNGLCHKRGERNNIQVFRCKACCKSQRKSYLRRNYSIETKELVKLLTIEGMGISSISRILDVPKSSVCRILRGESAKIMKPSRVEIGQEYEMDELKTFVGSKQNELWVCYAINRTTKQVVDYIVGKRTKENISRVVRSVLALSPIKVYTDRLNIYPALVPANLHSTKNRNTNYVERKNLTLRTHLKRLNRKTLSFSKSLAMLNACLRIYFWGRHETVNTCTGLNIT